jgi:hypothetical protein
MPTAVDAALHLPDAIQAAHDALARLHMDLEKLTHRVSLIEKDLAEAKSQPAGKRK